MKRENVSNNVIRRLPMYLRKLDDLAYDGIDRISSGELGKRMGLTPSQVRQDFSCFGEFGQQGYGYNIGMLRNEIAQILGAKSDYNVILVGVGNLGHALIENFGFDRHGFNLIAAFDIRPDFVGSEIRGVPIYSSEQIPEFLRENPADIAVLTVAKRMAKTVGATLAKSGVRGIWNFTNVDIELSHSDTLVENIHFSDSLYVLSYFLNKTHSGDDGR